MLAAIGSGFFRREIAESAFAYQKAVDSRQKIIVGVNAFQEEEHQPIDILQIDEEAEKEQLRNLDHVKKSRDGSAVRAALDQLKRAAERKQNVFPVLVEAARVRATVAETMNALAEVLGRYEPGELS
jgi:methylmalonyl-CoA mutase, N-terminal domain